MATSWVTRGNLKGPKGDPGTPAPTVHSHDAADLTGVLAAARMPAVTSVVRSQAFATSLSVNPAVQGNYIDITATADITSLTAVTTGAGNRQTIELCILASAAARNVTFATAIRTSTGITRGPYAIPSGQILIAALKFSTLTGAWTLVAATVSAT
jgi:hypothetical protein